MSPSAAKRSAEEPITPADERMDPAELAELDAAIAEADEQIARGEVYPAEQVLAEMRAILHG